MRIRNRRGPPRTSFLGCDRHVTIVMFCTRKIPQEKDVVNLDVHGQRVYITWCERSDCLAIRAGYELVFKTLDSFNVTSASLLVGPRDYSVSFKSPSSDCLRAIRDQSMNVMGQVEDWCVGPQVRDPWPGAGRTLSSSSPLPYFPVCGSRVGERAGPF